MNKTLKPKAVSGVIVDQNWTSTPGSLFSIPGATLTQVGSSTMTYTGQWLNNRSCVRVDLGTVNASSAAIQTLDAVAFASVGDYARITGAVNFGTGFHDNIGLFVGVAVGDTTLCNDTIASLPSDFVGLHKATTGTTFSLAAGDDSSTESVSISDVTIVADTWYDFCLEIVRTGTNEARVTLSMGQGTRHNQQFVSASQTTWTTTKLPDADAPLRFSLGALGDSTDNLLVSFTNCSFFFAKGNV